MKLCILLLSWTLLHALCSQAQSPLDAYLQGTVRTTVIGTSADGVNQPRDLAFNKLLGRTDELWVVNHGGSAGGSTVTFFHAGKPNQVAQYRKDSYSGHFMRNVSAIAFGDTGSFVTVQEIQNTSTPGSTFMGPTLWSSDTSIYARHHQNDNMLGSHLDMLHQSPFGMGVEHELDNIYWVFDGYSGNICRYDFREPHEIGGDDHSDGLIWRYSEVSVRRQANIPSHMVLDHATNWLYIVDTGNKRVLRLDIGTGTKAQNLFAPNEPLAEYVRMSGARYETVISTGLQSPCGIEYRDGRLLVGDHATGDIILYNTTTTPFTEMGRIATGAAQLMGIALDTDNRIWYVDFSRNTVSRLDPSGTASVSRENELSFSVYPNPSSGMITISPDNVFTATVRVTDVLGRTVRNEYAEGSSHYQIDLSDSPAGWYLVTMQSGKSTSTARVFVQPAAR